MSIALPNEDGALLTRVLHTKLAHRSHLVRPPRPYQTPRSAMLAFIGAGPGERRPPSRLVAVALQFDNHSLHDKRQPDACSALSIAGRQLFPTSPPSFPSSRVGEATVRSIYHLPLALLQSLYPLHHLHHPTNPPQLSRTWCLTASKMLWYGRLLPRI